MIPRQIDANRPHSSIFLLTRTPLAGTASRRTPVPADGLPAGQRPFPPCPAAANTATSRRVAAPRTASGAAGQADPACGAGPRHADPHVRVAGRAPGAPATTWQPKACIPESTVKSRESLAMQGALIVEARRHRPIPAVRAGRLLQQTAHPAGSPSLTMHEPGSPLAAGLAAAEPEMVTGAAWDQGHGCQPETATAIAEEFLKLSPGRSPAPGRADRQPCAGAS
jgi:hypothetical protein